MNTMDKRVEALQNLRDAANEMLAMRERNFMGDTDGSQKHAAKKGARRRLIKCVKAADAVLAEREGRCAMHGIVHDCSDFSPFKHTPKESEGS